ncbi:hypothetical protein SAMN05216548_114100 [Faunimonas pinastri]|uniref:Uncharacterized protein n=1 Tax=Faunimonas pinastri TaxID=1855383 RepID=A0A1H9MXQ9_9HYPH|nr:hypothetical protein [Faunimonas pinastri]SER28500.1 hypothetical protein SAMN05216548_114100 [Faunimonas pinastri]
MNAQSKISGEFSFELPQLELLAEVLGSFAQAADDLQLHKFENVDNEVVLPLGRTLVLIDQARANLANLEKIANSAKHRRLVFDILKARAFDIYNASVEQDEGEQAAGDEPKVDAAQASSDTADTCGEGCTCGEPVSVSDKTQELAATFAAAGVPAEVTADMAAKVIKRFPDAGEIKVINVGVL